MPLSLIPSRLFAHYREVTPELLRQAGITLLLSDLDFTLAPKSVRRPDPALRAWIAELKAAGIQVMIVSNNRSGARVTEFCADLGIPYQGHAGKPSTRGLEAAMARAGTDRAHTAMLGDKLLTDMLAANRAGVRRTVALTTSLSAEALCTSSAAYVVRNFAEVTDEMLR